MSNRRRRGSGQRPHRPAPKDSPVEPAPTATATATADGDLRGALTETRKETARLVRGLEAHRAQSELLLKEIDRQERDILHLLRNIAEVLNAFNRLLAHEGENIDNYRESARRTYDALMRALSSNTEMELIGRIGEVANPETHIVVETRDGTGLPGDTVISVVQLGMRYRGDLVQPAAVSVSSGEGTNS